MISRIEAAHIVKSGEFPDDRFFLLLASEAVSFAWSPCGNYLATGSGSPECVLRVFDIPLKKLLWSAREHKDSIFYLSWSSGGNYILSGSNGPDPRLIIWRCNWEGTEAGKSPNHLSIEREISTLPPFPTHHFDQKKNEWCGYYGFKKCAISPNEALIAGNAGVRPTKEYLVFIDLPDFNEAARVDLLYENHKELPWGTHSQLTSLSWTRDSRGIYFCQYQTLHFIPIDDSNRHGSVLTTDMVFSMCCCNPQYDIIALGVGHYESVGGLISIRLLPGFEVISEFTSPEGIVDLRWSADGNKLWAICRDGTAIQAELPLDIRK